MDWKRKRKKQKNKTYLTYPTHRRPINFPGLPPFFFPRGPLPLSTSGPHGPKPRAPPFFSLSQQLAGGPHPSGPSPTSSRPTHMAAPPHPAPPSSIPATRAASPPSTELRINAQCTGATVSSPPLPRNRRPLTSPPSMAPPPVNPRPHRLRRPHPSPLPYKRSPRAPLLLAPLLLAFSSPQRRRPRRPHRSSTAPPDLLLRRPSLLFKPPVSFLSFSSSFRYFSHHV
jgi:hypothetical protein